MKTTMIYTDWWLGSDGFKSMTRIVFAGEAGVDDIYLGREGFVEIRYADDDSTLVPLGQVLSIKKTMT